MPYNPTLHHRRSIRLKGYDYSQAGMYFVTICCQDRVCHFGKIENGEMMLNEFGKIAIDEWLKTAEIRKTVILHDFIVMPNHFHGIIEITNARDDVGAVRDDVGALRATPLRETTSLPVIRPYSRTDVKNEYMSSISPKCGELATIVRAFKSAVTKHVGALRATPLQPTPQKKLWQRDYWENIIRNEQSYQYIANYIINNPAKWDSDRFYTA
jgi:REP element-mobilizing transposase RayT